MYLLLILLTSYAGTILSKWFLLLISKKDFEKIPKRIFLLVPFRLIFLRSYKKDKKLIAYAVLAELLGLCTFLLLGLAIVNLLNTPYIVFFEKVINLLVATFILSSILYLAIYDLVTFLIPYDITKKLLLLVVLANLLIGLLRFIIYQISASTFLASVHLGYADNLISGIILGIIFWMIVKITKEKGMGEGDIDLVMIIGLYFGFPNAFISIFLTLIVGSLLSCFFALYMRKFKGLIVPFVPFILLGFALTMTFGNEIISFLAKF
jgi:leader peptidase (prepilin peptidase) / N-methyltransferase